MPKADVGSIGEIRRAAVTAFERAAHEAIAARGRFITALPGGSVADVLFGALATSRVEWSRSEIFWVDERAVPPDHADSNYARAARLLIEPANVPVSRVHRMHGELPDLEQAARRDADELKSIAGDPPRIDLVLVGVGEDGHVASIFPGGRGSAAESRDVLIPIYDAPKPPARRLTLAMPVLVSAGDVLVAAFGRAKAEAIRDGLERATAATPIAELLRRSRRAHVLLDRNAAELLS